MTQWNIQFRIELNTKQRSRTEWHTKYPKTAEEQDTSAHRILIILIYTRTAKYNVSCTLNYPCADYPVYRLSMQDCKLIMTKYKKNNEI
jgi:hypothetical protein